MILYSNIWSAGWVAVGVTDDWITTIGHSKTLLSSSCSCSSVIVRPRRLLAIVLSSSLGASIDFQFNIILASLHLILLVRIWWNFNAKRIPLFSSLAWRKVSFLLSNIKSLFCVEQKVWRTKKKLFSTCTWCCPQLQQSLSNPPGRILLEDIKLFPYFPSLA